MSNIRSNGLGSESGSNRILLPLYQHKMNYEKSNEVMFKGTLFKRQIKPSFFSSVFARYKWYNRTVVLLSGRKIQVFGDHGDIELEIAITWFCCYSLQKRKP
jgi:hypothetical protein